MNTTKNSKNSQANGAKLHPFIAQFLADKQEFDKKYRITQFAKNLGVSRARISQIYQKHYGEEEK